MLARMEAKLDANQEELRSTVNAFLGKMDAWIANIKNDRKERTARHEATEANPKNMEKNPDKIKSGAKHQEVPREEAAVKSSGAMKKWHRSRNLGVGRRGESKEQARGNGSLL
jgi:hypothetical protein